MIRVRLRVMSSNRALRILGCVAIVTAAVGCVRAGISDHTASATPCERTFPAVRCDNMVDYAAKSLGVGRDQIVAIAVLPPPTPEVRDGVTILHVYRGGPPVDTLVTLRDGNVRQVSMGCGGIPALQCRDDPHLEARSATEAGGAYFDTPSGAGPAPSPDQASVAAAKPLAVARLDIPIDHDGHYEVSVGEARLPNGILSVAHFGFASAPWPRDFTIGDGVVDLDVRSLDDPTRLFHNIYEHGRVDGTERVEAVLVFDVLRHQAGAVLSISDVIVR